MKTKFYEFNDNHQIKNLNEELINRIKELEKFSTFSEEDSDKNHDIFILRIPGKLKNHKILIQYPKENKNS